MRDRDGFLYIRNAHPQSARIGPADSVGSPSHKDLAEAASRGPLAPPQADVLREPRPEEELYRTPDDPDQVRSLVGDARYREPLAELRAIMDRWQDVTGDSCPAKLSQDLYDRDLGYVDAATGKRIDGQRIFGDPPGLDRGADRIDKPGPR